MVQFPINWTLTEVKVNTAVNGERISELKLNDEWTVMCFWHQNQFGYLKPLSVKIRRKFACKEILIFGTLSLSGSITVRGSDRMESKRKFSELMNLGSSPLEIKFNDPQEPILFCDTDYSLQGVINIISINEISSKDFQNAECRKCVQVKSLVELSNDFECLLNPETCCFADVTFKCGNASIPAHKSLLSIRSPVFAAMFKNPMKENRENKVDISDMDVSVLRIMLTYIYTGKTPDFTVSSASELLFAADKYQLQDLKRVCCDFLKQNISLENVLRILVLGDMHAEHLKSFAVDYICNKCTKFSILESTEEWKILRKERSDLAMDIADMVANAEYKMFCRSPIKKAGIIF
ncbi:Speckle-type POZ protein-like B [Araneus ventricosus]|uniref:Speckle-type POZ protein-like B n=1 Tax=Araneus ventricosus TaxID=182803 RepID=A0A4Y2K012_ARAVE|nr:Speckle-type POZ protein-like B [Araneus ventricosus]